MEWLHLFSFLYRYRCMSRFFTFFYSLCPLSFSHISYFWKRSKNLNISVSFPLFVNDGFLISQENSFEKINAFLFYSYNIILSLLKHFSLALEHRKSEVFYFSRLHRLFNSLSIDLSYLGRSVLCPKDNWRYLGFIFDRKLSFWQHIKFYSNKVLSIVKYMKILGNSTRELLPCQKRLLYRTCVLSIMLYGFPL